MADFALSFDHFTLVFGLSVMTPETVVERPRAKMGPFRMVRIPGLAIGGHMSTWNHDRIALDRPIMNYPGMARHTPISVPAFLERVHMFPMAHDKADLFHRRQQIARRNFGNAEDVTMATQATSGIDVCFQVMRFGRSPKGITHRIPCSCPHLVTQPAFESWSDMAGDAGNLLVRGRYPALIGWSNHMATGTEFGVVGQRNSRAAERKDAGRETEEDRKSKCPAHALIEHVGETAL